MGGNVVGDKTGVVAYVDDDGFLLVGVSVEADKWFGGRNGLQVIESLYGILQKICHYVRDKALVGISQQVLWCYRYFHFAIVKHCHTFEERLHIE